MSVDLPIPMLPSMESSNLCERRRALSRPGVVLSERLAVASSMMKASRERMATADATRQVGLCAAQKARFSGSKPPRGDSACSRDTRAS